MTENAAPRFPLRVLSAVLLATLLMAGWQVWSGDALRRRQEALVDRAAEINALAGEIARLDEVLTMSALMSAATGDSRWQVRYDGQVPALDAAVARALEISTPEIAAAFDSMTNAANQRLIAFETQAFEAVAAGRPAEALAVLQGRDYTEQKAVYAKGNAVFRDGLKGLVVADAAAIDAARVRNLTVTGALLLLAGAGWLLLARTLLHWRRGLVEAGEAQSRAAAGQLAMEEARLEQETRARQAETARAEALAALVGSFRERMEEVARNILAASQDLTSSSHRMTAVADAANASSSTVAAAAEQASASVATVAGAAVELSSSVGEVGRQVEESAGIATAAVLEAEKVNGTVAGLSAAATRIGEVVDLINGIAARTNLLALNATIEAARAGEAGKGFAVVAGEVKTLANQTARATDDIQRQVAEMQAATAAAVASITGVGRTIQQMDGIVGSIATRVRAQGDVTSEISRNVAEASTGTRDLSHTLLDVSRSVGETGGMAQRVSRAADLLLEQAQALRTEVDGFAVRMRAA